MEEEAASLTLGESLAHVPRANLWTAAVFVQIALPVGFIWAMMYALSPSFFISVPWRLALLILWVAYLSLVFMVQSYAELFLPRTPVAVSENIVDVGAFVVGLFVIGLMVSLVFASRVKDARVLVPCTCVAVAFIAGLVAFWVSLARKYGGTTDELSENNGEP